MMRARREFATVRPAGLVRQDPATALPDGALVACRNLRPVQAAGGDGAALEVVAAAARLLPEVEGILSAYRQIRQRPWEEDAEAGLASALDRWVLLRADGLYVAGPPGTTYSPPAVRVHAFDAPSSRVRAEFVPMGPGLLVLLRQEGDRWNPTRPLPALVLRDGDAVAVGGAPGVPFEVAHAAAAGGLPQGTWAFRAALRLQSGSYVATGPVRVGTVALGGDAEGTVALTFTVGVGEVPPGWRARTTGVGLFGSYVAEGGTRSALAGPYRLLGTVAWGAPGAGSATLAVTMSEAAFLGQEALAETNLGYLGLAAACGMSFNRRIVLGNVGFDFPLPALESTRLDGAPLLEGRGETDTTVILGVEIETVNGPLRRYSAPVKVVDGLEMLRVHGFSYPDRRARRLVICEQRVGLGGLVRWVERASIRLEAPATGNLAYVGQVDAEATPYLPAQTGDMRRANARLDHDPNRVLATDVDDPHSVDAARVIYVGDGPDDAVQRIATNALPASEGQFGDFDLYVFCRHSAHLVRTGAGADGSSAIFFQGVSPLAVGRGAAGPLAVAQVGTEVVAADEGGVRLYRPAPQEAPLSLPLHDAAVRRGLAAGAVLGWHRTALGDELWVALPPDGQGADGSSAGDALTFVLDLATGLWHELERERVAFVHARGRLYGLDARGRLWDEAGDSQGPVSFYLQTGALALGGGRGVHKRIFRFRVRQHPHPGAFQRLVASCQEAVLVGRRGLRRVERISQAEAARPVDGEVFAVARGSVLNPQIAIEGVGRPGQRLGAIDVEYASRYHDRLRAGEKAAGAAVHDTPNPHP